jgi:hypothetical protein
MIYRKRKKVSKMEKFTVVAQVRFEIEDVDLAKANRQAMASIALLTKGVNPMEDEYPNLNAPYTIGGDYSILDADGKVVQKKTFEEEEDAPEAE